ncbi:hypothetical protein ABZ468_50160 [Streptomyces sp. NPDC005708]|uniref:hypothetical protein n=1 Tax=Streptomyces sp. NPDC005708 TaxID=3154564 RepID=UPI0033C906E2
MTGATYLMLAGHLVLPFVVHHPGPGTVGGTGRASALCPRRCGWLAVVAGVAGLLLATATVLSSVRPGVPDRTPMYGLLTLLTAGITVTYAHAAVHARRRAGAGAAAV